MEQIKSVLSEFIQDPYNTECMFKLGTLYYDKKHYASAFTYFQRCAEYSNDMILSSECLLTCSRIMSMQGRRSQKEYDLIIHALSIQDDCPEVFFIKSRYHSWREEWTECYATCCLALKYLKNFNPTFKNKKYFDYQGEKCLLRQKAISAYKRGKTNEARKLCIELGDDMKHLPEPFEEPHTNGLNYSQSFQDLFVLKMCNYKKQGSYLAIGTGDYAYGNNTYLLEKEYDWRGISIDYNKDFVNKFSKFRKNKCFCLDATKIDYMEFLQGNHFPKVIDYLQVDCDPANITFEILEKIPFSTYKFRVITYEHGFYNDPTQSFRAKSRELLLKHGYKLFAGNITSDRLEECPFEDWWIHPEFINTECNLNNDVPIFGENVLDLTGTDNLIEDKTSLLKPKKYIIENETSVFNVDPILKTLNNYHDNEPATFKLFKTCNVCDCIRRGYRWEEHQHNIIDEYLDGNSIAIEAGGHVGTLAVKLAKTCKMLYTFEPVKSTYNLLKNNMELNCEDEKYTIFNKGLGESNKTEKISWISPEGSGGVGLTNNFIEPADQLKNSDDIEIITIDSLCLDELDYIKIDVEGYEENVINGGIETIKKFKPLIILECYESFSPLIEASLEFVMKKYDFLIRLGYEVKHTWKADFLFINPQPQKTLIPIFQPTHVETNNIKIGFDIGASSGTTLNLFDDCNIICAFEPNPIEIEKLKNRNNHKVFAYDYAIYDTNGTASFNCMLHPGYSSLLDFDESGECFKYCGKIDTGFDEVHSKIYIQTKRLDTFIEENNIQNIHFIKIDTQGTDFAVIKSLGKYIKNVYKIEAEVQTQTLYKNSSKKNEMIEFMNKNNFDIVEIIDNSIMTKGYEERITFINNSYTEQPVISLNATPPSVMVFENFYENPDEIRKYALGLNYQPPENHGAVGYRCQEGRKILPGTKEFFEKVLHCKIKFGNKLGEWDYSTNGCFQWCNKDVPLVYHADSQEYAGIIYLTPDAPPNCGTSLFKHKKYNSMASKDIFKHSDWHDPDLEYNDWFLDKEPWEQVDSVGNVYNRLVIFKSSNIHAVTEYFGNTIEDSRLFQLFFFNIVV